jgi:hypothetical protein
MTTTTEKNRHYDRPRSIFSHKKGKAIAFGEAWVDHYVKFGCDPDKKELYLSIVAGEGVVDRMDEDYKEEGVIRIDARNAAQTFIRRYKIKEWVDEQKILQATSYSKLVKDDYVGVLNAIIVDKASSNSDRMKALQQVTKMLGIEGASKIEQSGGFSLNMDYKKDE